MIYEYIVPEGEDSKSLSVYEEIIKYCIRINLSRKSLIIALGGGVVGDLAGFVASTYMRGIDVCQIPTSLLAQVDSSVGGKTGLIIALGGGVVGDLAGFVASTYMRGIDVCQIPTSLLAQVDSSVGGKTGLNIGNLKNVIGTFYQPKFTYINIDALKTLPHSEFISGMAEVIKYSIIYDYDFLDYLIDNSEKILDKDNETLCYMVKKSMIF